MARRWTSYEEVTPQENVDGRDNDEVNNNDNSRSRPRGNSRKYLCTCLIALLAVFGVLVGTYFILDHYQKLPSSLQFTKPPPTAAPMSNIKKTITNKPSSLKAATTLPPSGNFTNVNSTLSPTIAPPSSDLSVYCSPNYINVNTNLECSTGCEPGQCCSAQNERESCLEANMATCKLYSACIVLLAPTSSTNTTSLAGNGTTISHGKTNTTNGTLSSLAAPTGDLSSICSQDYLDANTNMECLAVCLPAQCCLQSATDSCLMDNLETCLMYQPCTILTKEVSSTSNLTTTTGNPPLEYLPEGVNTTGTNSSLPHQCVSNPLNCGCGQQSEYRGTIATTVSGKTCQAWSSQSPQSHDRTPANYPNAGLESNYCRNPDGEASAWCYTMDQNTRWELCNVPMCGSSPIPAPAPPSVPAPVAVFAPAVVAPVVLLKTQQPSLGLQDGVAAKVVYKGKGWIGIGLSQTGEMIGTDGTVIGIPNEGVSTDVMIYNMLNYTLSGVVPWTSDQQILQNQTIDQTAANKTIMTWRMPYPDNSLGIFPVIWAYGTSNTLAYHGSNRSNKIFPIILAYCADDTTASSPNCKPDDSNYDQVTVLKEGVLTIYTKQIKIRIPSPVPAPVAVLAPVSAPCPASNPLTCGCSNVNQADYRGYTNTTTSGRTCQAWTSQSPHQHTRTPSDYPNADLISNYCRNPDGEAGAWCYTTDVNFRWELCGIPNC